jgi:hypothetical protein
MSYFERDSFLIKTSPGFNILFVAEIYYSVQRIVPWVRDND